MATMEQQRMSKDSEESKRLRSEIKTRRGRTKRTNKPRDREDKRGGEEDQKREKRQPPNERPTCNLG
jgi:hypothetical protein